MGIRESSYELGVPQADGRRYVIERHTDDAGVVHEREFGPLDAKTDFKALLAERAAALAEDLADLEAEAAFQQDAAPGLVHQSVAQLAARFRAAYARARAERQASLAAWLLARIAAGTFTDAQARGAFGLTSQQYTALKTRMTTLRDSYATVVAAKGE